MDDAMRRCPYRALWNDTLEPLLHGRFPRATSTLSHPQTVRTLIRRLRDRGDTATACCVASLVRQIAYADHLGDLLVAEATAIVLGGEMRRPDAANSYLTLWMAELVPQLAGVFPAEPDRLADSAWVGTLVVQLVERDDLETACIVASLVHRLALTENRIEFQAGDAMRTLTGVRPSMTAVPDAGG